jgi:flagellar L-ring protein precursor FlgH
MKSRLSPGGSAGLWLALSLAFGFPAEAAAADLYNGGNWAALAADRPATQVGDSLTIIIDENSTASNSAKNGTKKASHFGFQLFGSPVNNAETLDLASGYDGSGQTQRTHKMIAQISVVVDAIMPNGYLHVTGAEALKINGEHTNIRVKGLVRPADIGGDNTVLSTRVANAVIDYDGTGFNAKDMRPGILTRVVSWLGLP